MAASVNPILYNQPLLIKNYFVIKIQKESSGAYRKVEKLVGKKTTEQNSTARITTVTSVSAMFL